MSIRWLLIGMIIFSTSNAFGETPLETRIRQILHESSLDPDRTGIAVVSVNRGDTLASINADSPLNPASCAKIVTAAAALSTLGPGYRFETNFYTDISPDHPPLHPLPSLRLRSGQAREGKIGSLYIQGNGDPSLVSEEMWQMVSDLKNRGIRWVTGDIVIDDTFFDGPWYPRKDLGSDSRAFTASTSAVSLNFNSAKFVIAPAARAGKKAIVTTDPPTPYIDIINKVVTGGKFRVNIAAKGGTAQGETFVVSGSIPPHAEPQSIYRVIANPAQYAGSVLKEMLIQNGIMVTGGVRKGTVPSKGTVPLLREQSKPLTEIVRDMNKFSNNFIAEQITKHLGAVKKGKPGSTAKGIEVFENYLTSIGVPRGAYTLENGSGLSDTSRISAAHLVKILSTMYRNHTLQPDFIESLSILGIDGTMKKWRAPQLEGWLRAKTGSLAGVSALAGYVPMQNGEVAAFAILANGFKKGKYSAHEAELMIASAIAQAR